MFVSHVILLCHVGEVPVPTALVTVIIYHVNSSACTLWCITDQSYCLNEHEYVHRLVVKL